MRKCDCHHRSHRDESLTVVLQPDYENGDPRPAKPGAPLYFCGAGLRARQRRRRALERGRRAYPRRAAA